MRCDYQKWKFDYYSAGKYFIAFMLLAAATLVLSDGMDPRPQGNSQTTSNDAADWNGFKKRFKKKYASLAEDRYRQSIRAQNLAAIRQHNAQFSAGKVHFEVAENNLVDLTEEEYSKMLGYRASRSHNPTHRSRRAVDERPAMPYYSLTVNSSSLPTYVNWTSKGWVGPVENQGPCASCWTYSAVASLESQYFNQTGQYVQLSQQNLIDCSRLEGNLGCDGGTVQNSYWYVMKNGIEPLSLYPDTSNATGLSEKCTFNSTESVMKVDGWRDIAPFSELSLQQAVALVGPVSAVIDASPNSFQGYSSGVYSDPNCSTSTKVLNHAILVVGYGVYNDLPYWLIQNSWGSNWGMGGYMMMARNSNNTCGIASDATFPVAGWTTTSVGSGSIASQSTVSQSTVLQTSRAWRHQFQQSQQSHFCSQSTLSINSTSNVSTTQWSFNHLCYKSTSHKRGND